MKAMLVLVVALAMSACVNTQQSSSQQHGKRSFSVAEMSDEVRDENGYGCELVDQVDLARFLQTADFESQRTIHDHFSVVGCSVTGKISMNGEISTFVFDYGGIMYLDDGRILACGENCCGSGYEYCTWEASPGES
ncbi:hypothetical protein ACFOZ5_14075 [Marinobacter lacisalsi]|uniref:Lipoprotein n=1 Tax=Marinobacter lacisalsi TaxID=475979 RepID=A0ABV8QKQ8_9GAMM